MINKTMTNAAGELLLLQLHSLSNKNYPFKVGFVISRNKKALTDAIGAYHDNLKILIDMAGVKPDEQGNVTFTSEEHIDANRKLREESIVLDLYQFELTELEKITEASANEIEVLLKFVQD